MASFTTEIKIASPKDEVWEALADIGNIYIWNPSVVSSQVTTEKAAGIGAGRHCNLGGKNYLKEEVVEWEPGRRLTMRIVETNLPFQTADIHFTLRPENNATVVTVLPDYKLKFGFLGTIMDMLFVRRTYVKGMNGLLTGLKTHLEQGQ